MSLQVTNTLSGKKEIFVPLEAGKVKMYVCGPTVYNFIHIGNARPLVFFDVVSRYLRFLGFDVTRVMNYTDVDDKIIQRAKEEKLDSLTVSEKYILEFLTDLNLLKVSKPSVSPKVTDHIPQIIQLVERLIKNGAAYVAEDGEVFFSVRNFSSYGKLSGKKIDDLISGARVQPGEKKKDPLDFSLWKPRKTPDEPAWDSPWGKGRPGWHIECSAMASAYLGETFDLHGGGMDLIHPHHENEIAQSEAASGKSFCKYWLHNNMITFQTQKMSKSIGNITIVRDFIQKYSAEALKYFLLSGHYRSTIEFSDQIIRDHQAALHRVYSTLKKAQEFSSKTFPESKSDPSPEEAALFERAKAFKKSWQEALDDDFNTAKVLAVVFDYVRLLNAYLDKKGLKPTVRTSDIASDFLREMGLLSGVLNLFSENSTQYLEELKNMFLRDKNLKREDIEKAIQERVQARAQKDFAKADAIRGSLLAQGIELRDSGTSTDWDVVLSATK